MCISGVNNIEIMKPLAYTGSRIIYSMLLFMKFLRKRSSIPLFVPEKALYRSWSFSPFLEKQKNTKILRSDPIIVQELNALLLIHSNVPDGKFCRSREFESRIQSCVIHIISVCTTGYTSYSTSTGPHRLIVKNPNYLLVSGRRLLAMNLTWVGKNSSENIFQRRIKDTPQKVRD